MTLLTHFDATGAARMVDVSEKPATQRCAVAEGFIVMRPATLQLILDRKLTKGDVLGIAQIAGIMAAKKTSDLIPLCHPILLTQVHVDLTPIVAGNSIHCQATVETLGPTGVEMEALMAVQVALLTVYDMCKAVDRGMRIEKVQLLRKKGGQQGDWERT